jgi:hypothetical protein
MLLPQAQRLIVMLARCSVWGSAEVSSGDTSVAAWDLLSDLL